MSDNVQLLNCPACGATLNPPEGQSVMQCPCCHSSVAINAPSPGSSDEDSEFIPPPPTPIGTPGFATQLLSFGSKGTRPGGLNWPDAIGVDQNGNIYVEDYHDKRITIFDSTGKFFRLIDLSQTAFLN